MGSRNSQYFLDRKASLKASLSIKGNAPSAFLGFDPHSAIPIESAAPETPKETIVHIGNLKEVESAPTAPPQNPKGGPHLKMEDTIFMGEEMLP
jgi:hypothetical protein